MFFIKISLFIVISILFFQKMNYIYGSEYKIKGRRNNIYILLTVTLGLIILLFNSYDWNIIFFKFYIISFILIISLIFSILVRDSYLLMSYFLLFTIFNIVNTKNLLLAIYNLIINNFTITIYENKIMEELMVILFLVIILSLEYIYTYKVKNGILECKNLMYDYKIFLNVNIIITIYIFLNRVLFYFFHKYIFDIDIVIYVLLHSLIHIFINIYYIPYYIEGRYLKYIKKRNDLLKSQIEGQYISYLELKEYYKNIAKVNHDIKNHNNILLTLIKNEDYEKLTKYATEINNSIDNSKVYRSVCKNIIINSICLNKKALCKENNIDIAFNVSVPEELPIKDIDICSIYGNLLDNAIESCNRIKSNEITREINLLSKISKGNLIISLINSKEGKLKKIGDKFLTYKSNNKEHGLGLEIVRDIVEKNKGYLLLKEEEKKFIIEIVISLKDI